jgi:hypothetical protein
MFFDLCYQKTLQDLRAYVALTLEFHTVAMLVLLMAREVIKHQYTIILNAMVHLRIWLFTENCYMVQQLLEDTCISL